MHQLIAESPRAQVQFFKLMDDIADIYFMGISGSWIGRHHVPLLFSNRLQEDKFACTCVPSLGGYGIAELEPVDSRIRGFQHGHLKVYKIACEPCRDLDEAHATRIVTADARARNHGPA